MIRLRLHFSTKKATKRMSIALKTMTHTKIQVTTSFARTNATDEGQRNQQNRLKQDAGNRERRLAFSCCFDAARRHLENQHLFAHVAPLVVTNLPCHRDKNEDEDLRRDLVGGHVHKRRLQTGDGEEECKQLDVQKLNLMSERMRVNGGAQHLAFHLAVGFIHRFAVCVVVVFDHDGGLWLSARSTRFEDFVDCLRVAHVT
jgi:hypothetical protein